MPLQSRLEFYIPIPNGASKHSETYIMLYALSVLPSSCSNISFWWRLSFVIRQNTLDVMMFSSQLMGACILFL